LGNPGSEYAQTRHNVGFLTVDILADRLGARYWKREAGAQTARVVVAGVGAAGAAGTEGVVAASAAAADGQELLLVRPQTFMNVSGAAVAKLADAYAVPPARTVVIADELDLPPGEVRTKFGGGHAGHRGQRSVIDRLGTPDYARVRVGIGRPPGQMDPADFVLAPMRAEAFADLQAAAERAADKVLELISS
jgi:PTH1 family peptidyl-tRNA hydrolase